MVSVSGGAVLSAKLQRERGDLQPEPAGRPRQGPGQVLPHAGRRVRRCSVTVATQGGEGGRGWTER